MTNTLKSIMLIMIVSNIVQNYQFNNINDTSEIENLLKIQKINESDIYDENPKEYIEKINKIISEFKFFNPLEINSNLENRKSLNEHNNIVAYYYFLKGEIEYLGISSKKPNLQEGFKNFLISAYFGNPKALYKLYILLETNIVELITKSKNFESLFSDPSSLISIIKTTDFYKNFIFYDDYERLSSANLFLYSASLSHDQSALTTLGFKYKEGHGMNRDCVAAQKYYRAASIEMMKDHSERGKPLLFERVSLEQYEYIANKFKTGFEIEELIDYFKVEADNLMVHSINQLGKIYLYGQGVEQNLQESKYYFELGTKINDPISMYFLGEIFLNGWGVPKDYEKALELFLSAVKLNQTISYNSLGYMYYYGLGVEKNIKRAYDYFKKSISKDEHDGYYNLATLLLEGNGKIDIDYMQAYNHLSIVSSLGHTYGTYLFGMMNIYSLGPGMNACELTIEFFKAVAERSYLSKKKSDLAIKAYKKGNYKTSALLSLELAEEGHEIALVNAAILLNKYPIFIDEKFNKDLAFKYFKLISDKNLYATLQLGDFYYYGYGSVQKDYKKAYDLYRKVIQSKDKTNFLLSHAYFNLALMNQFGDGIDQNYTKSIKFYNLSSHYDKNAFYPSSLMNLVILYQNSQLKDLIFEKLDQILSFIMPYSLLFCSSVLFVGFYLFFIISLKLQK